MMMSERRKIMEKFDANKEFLEKKIAEGIEKNRKGDCTVILRDTQGNPIPDAKISLRQKDHAFRFGANLFMLEELETAEKNEKYKNLFADVFNIGTLPFYWDTLEPERGKPRYEKDTPKVYRRPSPDLCIEFCRQHGIEPREHALAYEHFFPDWLKDASIEEIKSALEKRFAEIAERYASEIPTIEVTNEMDWTVGKTQFYDEPDYVQWCYQMAEKYFPNNTLCINEGTNLAWQDRGRTTDKYYAYVEACLLKGVRIDAIGMQYHLFNNREEEYEKTRQTLDPVYLYRMMDLYATFDKPIQITEVTVPAYSWEKADEELQAELIEKLYRIWFSHPNVEQIIYWNLVDGYAHLWDPDPEKIKASQGDMSIGENYYYGGLLRFDLSPKPAYLKLKDLIQNVWHTEEDITTDAEGSARFRGFYGNYNVTVTVDGKTVTKTIQLSKKSENEVKITL